MVLYLNSDAFVRCINPIDEKTCKFAIGGKTAGSQFVSTWSVMIRNFSILAIVMLLLTEVPENAMAGAVISWRSVRVDTAGLPVTGPIYYYVYRDIIPSFQPGQANFIVATVDTFFTDTDARLDDPSVHLFYAVKALDAYGNESAYSTKAGEVPFVLVTARAWLQATYDVSADTMTCSLKALDLLPFIAPYSESRRHASSLPAQITDWVLLQLVRPNVPETVGATSFLLRNDGWICELDGVNTVLGITGVEPGLYHLVVRHRNHMAAISRQTVWLQDGESRLFDFTADSSLYVKSRDACPIKENVWGLWSGDLNQDQAIDADDYARWRSSAMVNASGYQAADLNFDGLLNTRDYVIWYHNSRRQF